MYVSNFVSVIDYQLDLGLGQIESLLPVTHDPLVHNHRSEKRSLFYFILTSLTGKSVSLS